MDTEVFKQIIQRIVEERLSLIFKNVQSVLQVGTVTAIDTSGQIASVRIATGGILSNIPYPKNYSSTQIGIGQRVLLASADPTLNSSKFIIGAYGAF